MEGGLPMLNCLLQHTLRSLCTSSDSSTSSKWVYAVFWRVLPRNYPPPKWDYGGGSLDRAKGNKRNWILVWEDGFYDFYECERSGSGDMKRRFGAEVFFKMSHEVYSYGEGLVGKVAADNSHRWVFKDSPTETDPGFITSWNVSIDPQPRAWQFQFLSGIQTIAIISVREGIIQLGSFDKMVEDLNLVISIQRKFSYLESIPGIYATTQRPYQPIQHPYTYKPNNSHLLSFGADDKRQLTGTKRFHCEKTEEPSHKAMNLGYNSPQHGMAGPQLPTWSIPPLLPSMPFSLGALLSRVPHVLPCCHAIEALDTRQMVNNNIIKSRNQSVEVGSGGGLGQIQVAADIKVEPSCVLGAAQQDKPSSLNPHLGLEDGVSVELDCGTLRKGQSALNLN